ncbi:YybH family protein [Virgifigura deserti]|uniref:YybH family protein n=1 Tax=Virgifigura deserti TaxID=2268457 RepID=UPI003CCB90CA
MVISKALQEKEGNPMLQVFPAMTFVLTLIGAPATTPIASAQSQQDPGIPEDVQAAYETWNKAFTEGDARTLAETYLPDAKLLPPTHTVLLGPAEIEEFFAGLFANGVTDQNLEIIEPGGDGRIVYGTANWSAQGEGNDGAAQTLGGIATHVFERQEDGSLKLRLHTFN